VSPVWVVEVRRCVGVTDYQALLEAADWRRERLNEQALDATARTTTHALVTERNRLRRFRDFCHLAKEFDT